MKKKFIELKEKFLDLAMRHSVWSSVIFGIVLFCSVLIVTLSIHGDLW